MSDIIIVDGEIIEVGAVVKATPAQQCDDCGKVAETRPYGPNGESVCFSCGMKDEAAMRRAFGKKLGITEIIE